MAGTYKDTILDRGDYSLLLLARVAHRLGLYLKYLSCLSGGTPTIITYRGRAASHLLLLEVFIDKDRRCLLLHLEVLLLVHAYHQLGRADTYVSTKDLLLLVVFKSESIVEIAST